MTGRLTGRERYDLYRSIKAANPDADKDALRRLYRAALRARKT